MLNEGDVGKNLQLVFEGTKLSRRDFCEKVGIDYSNLSNYIKAIGKTKPSAKVKEIIEMGVNGTWFLTGEGEMWQKDVKGASSSPEELVFAQVGRKFAEAIELLNGVSAKKKESVIKAETFSENLDSNSTQLNSTRPEPRPAVSITKYRISEGRAARRGRTSRKKQQVLRAEEKTEVDRSVPLVCEYSGESVPLILEESVPPNSGWI